LMSNDISLRLSGGIIGRILFGQIGGLCATFDLFPNYYDFLYGATLPEWMTQIFGINSVNKSLGLLLMTHYRAEAVASQSTGVMNSLFVSDAYANFGIFGILVAPILVGIMIVVILHHFLSIKNPVNAGIIGWYSINLSLNGGLIDMFVNPKIIVIVTLIGLAKIFRSIFK